MKQPLDLKFLGILFEYRAYHVQIQTSIFLDKANSFHNQEKLFIAVFCSCTFITVDNKSLVERFTVSFANDDLVFFCCGWRRVVTHALNQSPLWVQRLTNKKNHHCLRFQAMLCTPLLKFNALFAQKCWHSKWQQMTFHILLWSWGSFASVGALIAFRIKCVLLYSRCFGRQ